VGTLALAILAPLAAANHPQTAHGDVIVFDHRAGNEWWVEVTLSGGASGSVSKVEAMDTGGPWVPLTKRSWGPYANSFHIEPGHQVQFRASWPGGEQVLSCWFTHPAGVEQCSGPVTPFNAKFQWPTGNEWWIQTHVDANTPLAGVDARADGGTWQPLKLQSWGDWAASFHILPGSHVQLRARASDGSMDVNYLGWTWPGGSPFPMFNSVPVMEFENVKGNPSWVQVNAYSDREIDGVQARINGGAWKPLVLQSWGDWAANIPVPDGGRVQFRGLNTTSTPVESGWCYRWPSGASVACDPTVNWPIEGSWVTYHAHSSSSVPGYSSADESDISLVFRNGAWGGTCSGAFNEQNSYGAKNNNRTYTSTMRVAPIVQTDVADDVPVRMPMFEACVTDFAEGVGAPDGTHAIKTMGRVLTVQVERAHETADSSAYQDIISYADQRLSMVLIWDHWHMHSHQSGEITGTDAPIGPVLTSAQQKALQGPWPKEGSNVTQSWCRNSPDTGCSKNSTTIRFEFRSGAWSGRCTGTLNGVAVDQPVSFGPALGVAGTPRDVVKVDRISGCAKATMDVVLGSTVPTGFSSGCCPIPDVTFIEAWPGATPNGSTPDRQATWDVESNLMLRTVQGNESTFLESTDLRLM
jgi:hypothetical protein